MGGLCTKRTRWKYDSSINMVLQCRQEIPCHWKQHSLTSEQLPNPDVYLMPREKCLLYREIRDCNLAQTPCSSSWTVLEQNTQLKDPFRVEFRRMNQTRIKVVIRRKICKSHSGASQYADVYHSAAEVYLGTLLLKIPGE